MKLWQLALPALALLATAAHAQHMDIVPRLQDAKITTDATTFGYDFQEDPADPYFIGDPGVDAPAGALTPGASLRFNVVSPLLYWADAAGPPAFLPATGNTALTLSRGITSLSITGASAPQTGFAIGTSSSSGPGAGSLHQHLASTLLGPDGPFAGDDLTIGTPDDNPAPPDGIYALQLTLYENVGGNDKHFSDPVWIVYNNGASESAHTAAMQALAAQAIPEPASIAILAVAGAALLARRRPA